MRVMVGGSEDMPRDALAMMVSIQVMIVMFGLRFLSWAAAANHASSSQRKTDSFAWFIALSPCLVPPTNHYHN